MAQKTIQSSEQAPALPAYILRGHSAQIHAIHFMRENTRLLTGDADGFVVVWSMTTKRATAVWKAHEGNVLGLGSWEDDKIVTHGRDNKLHIWQLNPSDEANLSTTLPIDNPSPSSLKSPWLLHTLLVNSLNFCSFTSVPAHPHGHNDLPTEGLFIATPGVQDGHINVSALPSEDRLATIPAPQGESTGMTMALGMAFLPSRHIQELLVLAGYESGHACVWRQKGSSRAWELVYMQKSHTQPILSLAISTSQKVFFTSSADALIVRHPLEESGLPTKTIQTKHAGQQDLTIRNDEKIFATAGWDTRVRVYSVKTMKELAVLKWHKEGCYAVAFAEVSDIEEEGTGKELTVSERREETAKRTHWLAAGSKDGKVSLWEVY